jgi:Fe-S cluster assembly protein SufD
VNALGFASDTSKLLYRGFIEIPKGVRGVDGAQEGKFLLLSPKAEIDAIPILDIGSKEVHCAHRVSVSPVTANELFYPLSRGLSEDVARDELLGGHIQSRLACIKHKQMVDILEAAINQ